MRRTNKKQCPKCKGFNIIDTKRKSYDVEDLGLNGKYYEPDLLIRMSIYKCNDCDREFILIETKD